MNIVFFGSGQFAVDILENIDRTAFPVGLVVTQPDRKKGRHLQLSETPVKAFAMQHALAVLQPEDVNAPESLAALKKAKADVFLVVSYGRILSSEVLSIPKKICVNIHSSLLPKYRGAAPVPWALLNGEKKTGVTFIKMNAAMDRGDILYQKSLNIDRRDTRETLDKKLSGLAAKHVNNILLMVRSGRYRAKKQCEPRATYAALLHKQDGRICWQQTPAEIYNRFRGCYGWPGSFTYYREKILKVLALKPAHGKNTNVRPGTIIKAENDKLVVACKKGAVIITEVLPESHKKMSVSSFLAGHAVNIGDCLDSPDAPIQTKS